MRSRYSTSLQDESEFGYERNYKSRPRGKNSKRNLRFVPDLPSSGAKGRSWSITPEELCTLAGISQETLSEWLGRGLLGKPDTRQRDNKIGLSLAQKTVLMSRLVAVGFHPLAAGHIVASHNIKDLNPLVAELPGGVIVSINRADLVAC